MRPPGIVPSLLLLMASSLARAEPRFDLVTPAQDLAQQGITTTHPRHRRRRRVPHRASGRCVVEGQFHGP